MRIEELKRELARAKRRVELLRALVAMEEGDGNAPAQMPGEQARRNAEYRKGLERIPVAVRKPNTRMRPCDVCGREMGTVAFLRGHQVCRKCERGEHPPRAEARPPSKGDGAKEEGLAALREGKDEPLAARAVTRAAGGAADLGKSAGAAADLGKSAGGGADFESRRGGQRRLQMGPKDSLPALVPGRIDENNRYCMTVGEYRDHQRGTNDMAYAGVRRAAGKKLEGNVVVMLHAPKGQFVERVLASEIW